MNKARNLLDSLMGPGRDVLVKDKVVAKEKFKDGTVCKAFLVGVCPLDPGLLGGKRSFQACEKIHSESMRQQFEAHPDAADLRFEYEGYCLRDLEHAVRECEARIANEKARIRDDWGRRRPPLPSSVIDKLSSMKRESSAMVQRAEALDDDSFKEKEALISRAGEIMKEAEEYEQAETKKAQEAAVPEEVCEVCGTCFQGKSGDVAHQQFKIHNAYKQVREHYEILLPKKEELEAKRKERKEKEAKERGDDRRKRRDDSDAQDGDRSDRRGRGREDDSDRGRGREERGRDRRRSASRGRDRGDRGRGGGNSARSRSRRARR